MPNAHSAIIHAIILYLFFTNQNEATSADVPQWRLGKQL